MLKMEQKLIQTLKTFIGENSCSSSSHDEINSRMTACPFNGM